ncbi:MAG TPA: YggT family protein [Candidatus Limnocylindrales bacterium]|nr:YggT family protein [Candidatus Limnocylindrales bacterium]
MERRETDIERDAATGEVREHRTVTTEEPGLPPASSEVVTNFNPAWRGVQAVYLVFGIIEGLLVIRLALKLLGANPTAGFSNFIYNVTGFFLAPFKNILPTIGSDQAQLEMSVVLAILVYALAAWAIARLVAIIFYRNVTVARRSGGGLRPRGY